MAYPSPFRRLLPLCLLAFATQSAWGAWSLPVPVAPPPRVGPISEFEPARQARYAEAETKARLAAKLADSTPGGDINYIVTRLLTHWIEARGVSYTVIADVVGVLETAKLELYRRVAGPYEDRKIEENGDVYGELSA